MDELQYDAIILKSITNYGEFDAKDNFRYTQRIDMNGQEKDQMAFMNTGETYYLDFIETDSISVNRIYNGFNGRAVFHDFNNDGALDFLSTDSYDSHVKINSGTNSFSEIGVKSSKTRIPAFYDLDFDGYEAPVLSNSDQFYSFSVYDNFSSTGSERMRMLFPPNSVGGLEFIKGDLDNDHQLDLLVNHASSNKLTILYKSNKRFTERLVDNDFNADALELADIDGDNDLDILSIAVSDSVVTIFENIGSYQFTKHRLEVLTSNSSHLQIIDVDGDDYKDIVVGSFKADSLKWYKNNGDLSFESKPILTEIPNAQILAAFDPDKDGNLEFTGISLDSADQEYDIFYIPQTNNPPYIKQEIGSIVKNEGFGTYQINLDSIFGDYYGETLTYSLNHLADSAVSTSLSASMLTIEELGPGTSQNTITATDEVGKTVSLDYSIKNNKAPKIIVDSSAFIMGTYDDIRLYGYQLFKDVDGTYLDSKVIMESNDLVTIDYYNDPTFRWSRLDISSKDSSGSVPIKFIIDDGQGGVDSASFEIIVNKRPQSIKDLPNILVNISDGKDTLNLNEYFTDFEGEQLGFSVALTSSSSNDSASHVDIVNDSLLVVRADTLYGRDRYRVDATDSYGASWSEHMYIRVNGAPYLKKKFEDIVLRDYQSKRFDLMDYFADVDSYYDFDYYLHSSDTNIVKSSYEYNDRYTLNAQSFGVATVTFEAFDDGGLKAQDSIQVYVNDYPRIVADWSSLVLNQGFESYQISLDSIFTDLEDDSLYYDLTQGNGGLPAEIEGDILSIEETSTTDVIYYNLTAYDSIGGGNQFIFSVRVNEKPKLTTTLDTLKINEEDSLMNHINLNDYFNDVDEIFYSINSSDTSIVKVDQESSYLSLFATSYGRSYIEIVAEDPYNLSTTAGFWVEANGRPYITGSIENQVVNNDTSLLKFTFADHFADPEEDSLQYSVTSDNNNVLIDKDDLGFSLDPQSIGWSKLSIVAIDDMEAKSEINFDVLINDIPEALKDAEFLLLNEGFIKHEINLNAYFSQTDDSDSLVFELVDEDNSIVSLDVTNNQLVISEKGEFGSCTFTVIAKDIYGAKAKIPFEVNVNKKPIFTNSDSISVIYNEGFVADSIDLNPLFEDDNELTYKLDQLSLEDSDYLEAYLFEDMLIIKELGNIGVIHFTLVGTDPYDLSDEIKFSIKINGAPNIGLVEDIELIEGFESYGFDLEDFTNDPEGDSISYEVFIDDNSLLNASITHNYLTIEEKDIVGVTNLLLVASDTYDAIDSVKFKVSILSKDETVTSNNEAALENLIYYPNPVTDFLFIKDVLIKNIKSLVLVDLYGRQQNPTYFIDEKLIKVDFSRTSKGIYFLVIMNEDGSTKSIKVNKD
ncbi:MAG: T9SS type A sorting domain-containing protein [Bacteroidota bacterium]